MPYMMEEEYKKQQISENELNEFRKATGGKTISEVVHGFASRNKSMKEEILNDYLKRSSISPDDRQQAEIELSYLKAALTLCMCSNDISCEIVIGSLPPIGISVNSRIAGVLREEIEEIEKYLQGQPNNYE